jgi:hypothetical protein
MSRKLTAKQVKELASFYKKAASKHQPTTAASVRYVASDEAAKLFPGIVTEYTVKFKRPPTEGSTRK